MTRKNIRAVSRGHDEATVESLRKDPKFAVEYLNAVLQEGVALHVNLDKTAELSRETFTA